MFQGRLCRRAPSCTTLCDPMDYSLPGSSVHGILQARILEWVAKPSSRASSWPSFEPASPASPALAGRIFTTQPPGEAPKQKRLINAPEFFPEWKINSWDMCLWTMGPQHMLHVDTVVLVVIKKGKWTEKELGWKVKNWLLLKWISIERRLFIWKLWMVKGEPGLC